MASSRVGLIFHRTPGAAKKYLDDNFSLTGDSESCRNGHVLKLYLQNEMSVAATMKAVGEIFGRLPAKHYVTNLVTKTKHLFRSVTTARNRKRFEEICNTPVVFVAEVQRVPEPLVINRNTIQQERSVSAAAPGLPVQEGSEYLFVSEHGPSSSVISPPRPLRLRTGDTTPRKQLMRKRLLFQSE